MNKYCDYVKPEMIDTDIGLLNHVASRKVMDESVKRSVSRGLSELAIVIAWDRGGRHIWNSIHDDDIWPNAN